MARGKVAVLVFPGTNSEEETQRICNDVGMRADIVHWSKANTLPDYGAYILPGGFAYEDRIRAGAIAAHDRAMDHVIDAVQSGKPVLGICNGAQILLEAGVVPGTGEVRRPTAAFTKNGPVPHFMCRHVHLKLSIDPSRCVITAGLEKGEVIPAWVANGEGRLAATPGRLDEIAAGAHLAFVFSAADGNVSAADCPNGSALGCAALTNKQGNVLAIMPHPERDAWNFNHYYRHPRDRATVLQPSGGSRLFESMAKALR